MLEQLNQYIWSYNACDASRVRSPWRHLLQILTMVGRDLKDGMITLRAMSLVYTTLLAMVPLLAVSISVLKGFGVHDQLEPTLVSLLAPLGEQSIEISARIVGFVDNMKIGVLGAVGVGLLIYTSISLIQKIESAFNYTWRLQQGRNLVQRFSDYLSVIMVGPVLIFSAVGITASLSSNQIVEFLNTLPYMNELLRLFGKLLPYVLAIAAFTFVYLLVPNTRVKFGSALYGAVIAGALWQTTGILFASFVGGSTSYTAIYSGFAILLMFMIWLYLSWIILLIGASISFYHQNSEQLQQKRIDFHLSGRLREQLALQAMVNIARAHDQRSALVPSLENLASNQRVPVAALKRMLDALQHDGLVQRSAQDPPLYLPGSSLRQIKLVDILQSARKAEDNGHNDICQSDAEVSNYLRGLEQALESHMGEESLAQFIQSFEDESRHEDSLV
ncbi:MAG: YihY/virulence factor BrkB family protein [Gammaproteobacteria bacterium]|nr:YihY/virulence factor BrkB family protein [Gammaproteobacteria bacterium]MDH3857595.1 YihY/virulence factor BrkB family protein [Gammaproteobacteria bacterium]